jgi:hypothetical protein
MSTTSCTASAATAETTPSLPLPDDAVAGAAALLGAIIAPVLAITATNPALVDKVDPAIAAHLRAAGAAHRDAERARVEALASETARADAAEKKVAEALAARRKAENERDAIKAEHASLSEQCAELKKEADRGGELAYLVSRFSIRRDDTATALAAAVKAHREEGWAYREVESLAHDLLHGPSEDEANDRDDHNDEPCGPSWESEGDAELDDAIPF